MIKASVSMYRLLFLLVNWTYGREFLIFMFSKENQKFEEELERGHRKKDKVSLHTGESIGGGGSSSNCFSPKQSAEDANINPLTPCIIPWYILLPFT